MIIKEIPILRGNWPDFSIPKFSMVMWILPYYEIRKSKGELISSY